LLLADFFPADEPDVVERWALQEVIANKEKRRAVTAKCLIQEFCGEDSTGGASIWSSRRNSEC
jgi:hypothetical protein